MVDIEREKVATSTVRELVLGQSKISCDVEGRDGKFSMSLSSLVYARKKIRDTFFWEIKFTLERKSQPKGWAL